MRSGLGVFPTAGVISGVLLSVASAVPVAQAPVTFTRDVAPLLYAHCAECHRPNGAAPFSLLTYADARLRARLMTVVTERRIMPPWQPLREGPPLKGARHLDERALRVLRQWVADGTPEGNPSDLPAAPPEAPEWQLGTPDLIVSMPEPFDLPGGGADSFRNFVLPVKVAGTRYVQAIEFRPGNPRAVHHARVMVDDSGTSRRLDAGEPGPGYGGMDTPGARFPDGFCLGWAGASAPSARPPPGRSRRTRTWWCSCT